MEHVLDYDTDAMLLSETWLRSKKNNATATVEQYGYKLHHSIRKDRAKECGGGVGILVKKCLSAKPIKVKQFQTLEHCIIVKVCLHDSKWITLISIYRLDYESIDLFFTEFMELLELFAVCNGKCIIAGDINIHCDNADDSLTIQLNKLLSAFNLTQVIDVPTHKKGHILDVAITHTKETKISEVEVRDIALGDHFLLSFSIDCSVPRSYYETITYRKRMNSNFQESLVNTLKSIHIGDEFIETVQEDNDKVAAFVESQAPKVTKEVKIVIASPWFDSEYKELQKHRRKAEKKF